MTTLYMVIPCYNEEEVLPETSRRLAEKYDSLLERGMISDSSRILFVDDGSRDRTWELICSVSEKDPRFGGVKLSRNRGHQNALLAGLSVARGKCDAAISMDADLQDDIGAVDGMLEKFADGCEVVYGVRSSRETDTFFKRETALAFYRLMQSLGVDVVNNHADYRLLGSRALNDLFLFDEVNLFLRGIVPQIGYKSGVVTYVRGERFAGESKYPLKKMLKFALDGITSFSVKPLSLITWAGGVLAAVSAIILIIMLGSSIAGGSPSSAAVICTVLVLVCGIQLLALGVVGEYIGRIYQETKRRPRFIIEETIIK